MTDSLNSLADKQQLPGILIGGKFPGVSSLFLYYLSVPYFRGYTQGFNEL